MSKTPAIATIRHEETLAHYKKKLVKFNELISDSRLDEFPGTFVVQNFINWEDKENGIFSFGRAVIYSKAQVYVNLKQELDDSFKRANQSKNKSEKRKNIIDELNAEIQVSRKRAEDYKNQWASSVTELEDAKKEIARLNQALNRRVKNERSLVSLHSIPDVN
jgi:hypothetical protein